MPDRLYGVAASSWRDIWAVGLAPNSSLIMHYNGRNWAVRFNNPVGYFIGVAAVSSRYAWAVGGTNWFTPSQTLAERWNGTRWTRVPTPNPDGGGYFNGVTATSARNAWAAGVTAPGGPGVPAASVPLIEHWNGTKWRQQPVADPPAGGVLKAVAATSYRNAWAVGWTGDGYPNRTLIEHWNGKVWKRVPSPSPEGGSLLQGVSVISAHDAWAVGFSMNATGPVSVLILHWNGYHWHVQRSPTPAGDTNLDAVTALTHDNAWAVGYTYPTQCSNGGPACEATTLHWNGTSWREVPVPNPAAGYLNAFLGVVAISASNVWAVGTTDFAATLIAHWAGHGWN